MLSSCRRLNIGIFVLVTVLFSFLFINPSCVKASDILLEENFDDGNANDGNPVDWDEFSSTGVWEISNGQYIGTLNPSTASMTSLAGDQNWTDYEIEVDVESIQGVDRHIYFRFAQYHISGYSIKYSDEESGIIGAIELQKHGENVVLQTNSSFKTHLGETHHFRIRTVDNHIEVFADNNPDPILNYTDNHNPILQGKVGFEIQPSGSGFTNQTGYDNLIVKSISPSGTSLPVPDIKQYSLPWGPLEYDSAKQWIPKISNISIGRWGCALTSGNMILNFLGYDINPQSLNTWLRNDKGYTPDGGVRWPEISAYSKLHENEGKPILEFRYKTPDTTIIDEELQNQRPVILKYAEYNPNGSVKRSHFVVVKGKEGNDYLVNDPDSNVNTTKSQVETSWGMSLVNTLTFTPSHTDISYLVFSVDFGFTIDLYDGNGNEVDGDAIVEGPITATDKVTPSGNGKSYQTLYIPKPESGLYTAKVSGNGAYTLNSYLLDTEGKNKQQQFSGSAKSGRATNYNVSFNKDLSSSSEIKEISFEALITSLDNAYKSKLIKNKLLYLTVKTLVETGKYEYAKGKVTLAKKSLELAKTALTLANSSQIDTLTKDQLILQINILLSTL